MRNAVTLAGILLFGLLPTAALAATAVAGSVVDRDGQGIDKAEIHFYADGRDVGHGRSDKRGRFSIDVTAPPETWTVEAKNFETRRLRFVSIGSDSVVLSPREPKAPAKLDGADFEVLPYQDVGYVFSLAPFTVIQGGGAIGIGDRGLSGSANALQSNGTSFESVPAHYLSFASIADAFHSYRYSGGAAGHYTLGFDKAEMNSLQAGGGSLQIDSLQGRFGDDAFGYGFSSGDLTQHSRVDLVSRSPVGAGKLLVSVGRNFLVDQSGSTEELGNGTQSEVRLDEPWLGAVATFELKAKNKTKNKLGDYTEYDSEIEGEFRLRNEGALFGNEFGVKLTRDTGSRAYTSKMYSGTAATSELFARETYTGSQVSADATVAWYGLHDAGATHKLPGGIAQSASGAAAELRATWQFAPHLVRRSK